MAVLLGMLTVGEAVHVSKRRKIWELSILSAPFCCHSGAA